MKYYPPVLNLRIAKLKIQQWKRPHTEMLYINRIYTNTWVLIDL